MNEMRTVQGFEDVWRPPVRPRKVRLPENVLGGGHPGGGMRARLSRIVSRAPEVMLKVTGRTRDAAHLRAHLDYITRNGQLAAEGRDGVALVGREEVHELGDSWAWSAMADRRRRANAPLSVSLILSMPAGTDAIRLRDAARAFAQAAFEDRHDYVLVLHTDTPHPHVHVTVSARGDRGERLNPKKADLEAWRQAFAQALRDRGVDAEATPRQARGVTRKAERNAVRRMRERHATGRGAPATVTRRALEDAARIAAHGSAAPTVWELQMARRHAMIRGLYRAQAEVLRASRDPGDRRLALVVDRFLADMPAPDTQRLAQARRLRDADMRRGLDVTGPPRREPR